MADTVLSVLLAARAKALGPEGPDKQNGRVLFHTLLWNNWNAVKAALEHNSQQGGGPPV